MFLLSASATVFSLLAPATSVSPAVISKAGSEEAAVLAPIERIFGAMARRDAAALFAQLRPEGGATVAIEDGGLRAISHRSWAEFATTLDPGSQRYEERLLGPVVKIDGDIAMIWSRYVFLVDGRLRHCGTAHVDLVREASQWKVLNMTWSQRTAGCTES